MCFLFGLTLSPLSAMSLRVNGSLSAAYRFTSSETQNQNTQNKITTLDLSASSYIWRPWFAIVNASGGFSRNESETSRDPKQLSEFTTGSGRMGIFPTSRFPFIAHYAKADSRSELEDISDDFRTTSYGFSQQYRSQENDLQINGAFDKSVRKRTDEKENIFKNAVVSLAQNIGSGEINLSASGNKIENKQDASKAKNFTLTGRHHYSGNRNFSLNNLLNKSFFQDKSSLNFLETTTKQFSSVSSWRPENIENLSVISSIRAQETDDEENIDDEIDTEQLRVFNVSTTASYQFNPEVDLTGGVSANQSTTERKLSETDTYTITESVGSNYHPASIDIGDYQYATTVGGNLSNQSSDIGSSQQVSFNANHSLERELELWGEQNVRMNVVQGFSSINSTRNTVNQTLTHTFNLSWNPETQNGFSTARFSLSDLRELSEDNVFQIANLQFTHNENIDRDRSWFGDLTLQASRSISRGEQNKVIVTSGSLRYQQANLFDVQRLNFRSDISFSSDALSPQSGSLNESSQEEMKWENVGEYRFGMLLTEMSTIVVSTNGKIDRAIQIKISRVF